MTLAVVADHLVDTENDYTARRLIEPDIAKNVFRIEARAGVPIPVTKLVSYQTSRGVPKGELIDRCRTGLARAETLGVDELFARQQSQERRGGEECVRKCSTRRSAQQYKNKKK